MSTPITPTEAHIGLAIAVNRCSQILHGGAQLIAESEARAQHEWKQLAESAANKLNAMVVERDQLRARAERAEAELKRLSLGLDGKAVIDAWWNNGAGVKDPALGYLQQALQAHTEALRAELAAERARLGKLRQAVLDVLCDPEGKACFAGSDGDRAAIDAAMKEDAT